MKSILMSIKPQWVAKILNGEKTLEIRKRFPKDYVGWVYIYCTKKKPYLKEGNIKPMHDLNPYNPFNYCWYLDDDNYRALNGEVVARFWCDKVEKVHCNSYGLETSEHWYRTTNKSESELLNECALTFEELDDYLCFGNGYAIYITKLEIFDKPKEISEFKHLTCRNCKTQFIRPLTRAPQSWCYVEE